MNTAFAPRPESESATSPAASDKACRWCEHSFETVPQLLDHVVMAHLDETAAA